MNYENDDEKLLAEFSLSKRGAAVRAVLKNKDDILAWVAAGWTIKAIYRLLESKGVTNNVTYESFCRALKKIAGGKTVKKKESVNRPSPRYEAQRKEPPKFVQFKGTDHIGLDK